MTRNIKNAMFFIALEAGKTMTGNIKDRIFAVIHTEKL